MGTRGLSGFVADGKWFSMYNHFDSYPSGLGNDVLNFCKTVKDWDAVKVRVLKVKLVDNKYKPSKQLIAKYSKFANLSVDRQTTEEWYCLLRELQGVGILEKVADGTVGHMIDGQDFITDSLFCEWAYLIDLDKMTLNVYQGFQKTPPIGTPLPNGILPEKDDDGHYPCKMIYSFPLNELPDAIPEPEEEE
jgi:hypothetical protein